ncbi:hypothetical protein NC652_024296 [Populus alba x Populus x berolinensis]|nr:hypothetical protein NC652_024296 [Populus alba x Populus x berolinensis]
MVDMAMEEGGSNESCGSRVNENTTSPGSVLQERQQQQRMQQKLEVYNEILRLVLKKTNHEEANLPGFDDHLWTHFNRLPARYALDVNVERAEDVLMHKRLLHLAHDLLIDRQSKFALFRLWILDWKRGIVRKTSFQQVHPTSDDNSADFILPDSPSKEAAKERAYTHHQPLVHHTNLEALALEANKFDDQDGDNSVHANSQFFKPMHEITFSSDDRPKLLSQFGLT